MLCFYEILHLHWTLGKNGYVGSDKWFLVQAKTIIWLTLQRVCNQNHIQYWAPLTRTKSWHLATNWTNTTSQKIKTSSSSPPLTGKFSPHRNPTENVLWLFTHFSAKNTIKNGNVMRHGELIKCHISFMISDSSHEPSKMSPTDNKHNVEEKKKNDSELLTSLHFQCDTFFQHTLNFTFSSFNKKTDTTYF